VHFIDQNIRTIDECKLKKRKEKITISLDSGGVFLLKPTSPQKTPAKEATN